MMETPMRNNDREEYLMTKESTQVGGCSGTPRHSKWRMIKANFQRYWGLYLLLLPTLIYAAIFLYGPMYGLLIAFKDYNSKLGVTGSPWADPFYKYLQRFFTSYNCGKLIGNTLTISLYTLAASFPIPILFALMLNQLPNGKFKKLVQTVSYAPHFISTVVLVSMLSVFLAPSSGIVNILITKLGGQAFYFMGSESAFKHVYVWSGIWQSMGWSSIIYVAALAGVSPDQHEAAIVDGANKIQRIWYVDIPAIMPTAVTMLILNTGNIMSIGFEKAFLMQNNLNTGASEIISTYVYKVGILNGQFSYSTAIGMFNAVICCVMVLLVNWISRKTTESGLW